MFLFYSKFTLLNLKKKATEKRRSKASPSSKAFDLELKIVLFIGTLNVILVPIGIWLSRQEIYSKTNFYILILAINLPLAAIISIGYYLSTIKYRKWIAELPGIYNEYMLKEAFDKPVRRNYLVINCPYHSNSFVDPNNHILGECIYLNYQPQIYKKGSFTKKSEWINFITNNDQIPITTKAEEITILDKFKFPLKSYQIGNFKKLKLSSLNFKNNDMKGFFDSKFYYPAGKKVHDKDFRYSVKTIPYRAGLSYMAEIGAGSFEIKPIINTDLTHNSELFYFNVDEAFLRKNLLRIYSRNKYLAIWLICILSSSVCALLVDKL